MTGEGPFKEEILELKSESKLSRGRHAKELDSREHDPLEEQRGGQRATDGRVREEIWL